jgi:hypothetical protein
MATKSEICFVCNSKVELDPRGHFNTHVAGRTQSDLTLVNTGPFTPSTPDSK